MDSPQIPDELLCDIFLRLPNPADLIRAAAACVSFRRIVADRSFLRLYRKLHAPPLLGFLDRRKVFHPAIAPHPSASAAHAVALAADFSFSFLPARATTWVERDIRSGRVLLDRLPEHNNSDEHKVVYPEMVVCDPLHGQYVLLPPIPAHLTAMVEPPLRRKHFSYYETFLSPPGDGEEEASAAEETSFRVVWMAQCITKLVAFVFSSSTGQWRAISSQSCNDLFAGVLPSTGLILFTSRQYAYGCFYWVADWREKLLVLDTRRTEFSVAELPREARGLPDESIAIVEAGGGMLGMFVHQQYANYLNYSIRKTSSGSSSQWQFEKAISLDSRYMFMGSIGRRLFLFRRKSRPLDAGGFLLDVKTFQLERVFVSNSCIPIIHAYNNFPPSLLSTPTVSNATEKGPGKEMLEQGCAASSNRHHGQNSAVVNAGG